MKKRPLERIRGYRTCVIVTTIARAGGVVSDDHLRTRLGKYARNVIYGVAHLGFIHATDEDESHWELTAAGRELAEQLLGETYVALCLTPPLESIDKAVGE